MNQHKAPLNAIQAVDLFMNGQGCCSVIAKMMQVLKAGKSFSQTKIKLCHFSNNHQDKIISLYEH
jgi:muramidase (phage lysozyme)